MPPLMPDRPRPRPSSPLPHQCKNVVREWTENNVAFVTCHDGTGAHRTHPLRAISPPSPRLSQQSSVNVKADESRKDSETRKRLEEEETPRYTKEEKHESTRKPIGTLISERTKVLLKPNNEEEKEQLRHRMDNEQHEIGETDRKLANEEATKRKEKRKGRLLQLVLRQQQAHEARNNAANKAKEIERSTRKEAKAEPGLRQGASMSRLRNDDNEAEHMTKGDFIVAKKSSRKTWEAPLFHNLYSKPSSHLTQLSGSTTSSASELPRSNHQEGTWPTEAIYSSSDLPLRHIRHLNSEKSGSIEEIVPSSEFTAAPEAIESPLDYPPTSTSTLNLSQSEQHPASDQRVGDEADPTKDLKSTSPSELGNKSAAPGLSWRSWKSILDNPTYTQDEWVDMMLMADKPHLLKGELASHPKTKILLEDSELMAQFTIFFYNSCNTEKLAKLSKEEIKNMHVSCRPIFEALAFLDNLEEEPSIEGAATPENKSFANEKEMLEYFNATGIPTPSAQYSSEGELLGYEFGFDAEEELKRIQASFDIPAPEHVVRAKTRLQSTPQPLLLRLREYLEELARICGIKGLSSLAVSALFITFSAIIFLDLGGIWVQSASWAVAALYLLKDICVSHIFALTKPTNFGRAYLTVSVPVMLIMSGTISMKMFTTNDPDRLDILARYYRHCVHLFEWCLVALHIISEVATWYKFERYMMVRGSDLGASNSKEIAGQRQIPLPTKKFWEKFRISVLRRFDNGISINPSKSEGGPDPTPIDKEAMSSSEVPEKESTAPVLDSDSPQKKLQIRADFLGNLKRIGKTTKKPPKESTPPHGKAGVDSTNFESEAAIRDIATSRAEISTRSLSSLSSIWIQENDLTAWTAMKDALKLYVMGCTIFLIVAAFKNDTSWRTVSLSTALYIFCTAGYTSARLMTTFREHLLFVVSILMIPGTIFALEVWISMPNSNYLPESESNGGLEPRFWIFSFSELAVFLFIILTLWFMPNRSNIHNMNENFPNTRKENYSMLSPSTHDTSTLMRDAVLREAGWLPSSWSVDPLTVSKLAPKEYPIVILQTNLVRKRTIPNYMGKRPSSGVRLEDPKVQIESTTPPTLPITNAKRQHRYRSWLIPKEKILMMLDDGFRADVLTEGKDPNYAMFPEELGPEMMHRFLTGTLREEYLIFPPSPGPSKLSLAISSFTKRFLERRKLDDNIKRLEWTCKCGHKSHDDFQEISKDAVIELANEMFKAGYITHAQISAQASSPVSSLVVTIQNFFTGARRRLSGLRSSTLPTFNSKASSVKSIAMQCLPSQRCRWLHMCLKKPPYATKLQPLHVCKDEEEKELTDATFFRALRRAYFGSKSWKDRLLFKLKRIEFVEFELCPEDLVDHILPDKLPPTLDEYEFLPPPPVKKCPPIGIEHMMHLFTSCSAQPLNTSLYLRHIPKRKKQALSFQPDVLDAITGWGLYFVEGLNSALAVTVMFTVSLLLGIVFAVCWSIWRKDVQGAFGVASYVTSVITLAVMTWQMWAI